MRFPSRTLVPLLAAVAGSACSRGIDPAAESAVSRGFTALSIVGQVPGLEHEHTANGSAMGAGPPQYADRNFDSAFRVSPGGGFDEAAFLDRLGTALRNRVTGSGARLVRLSRAGAAYHAEYAADRATGSIDVWAGRGGNGEYVVKGKLHEIDEPR